MRARTHKQHFIVLDGMRGIAAIVVACLHSTQIFLGGDAAIATPALAVDFFFSLSGFVIAYSYGSRLNEGMSFDEFAVRRTIRLYPMIFFGAAIGSVVLAIGALHRDRIDFNIAAEVAGAFMLVPTGLFFGSQAYPVNNPIWSLFFECVANIVYAMTPKCRPALFYTALSVSASALVTVSYCCGGLGDVGFENWIGFLLGFVRVCYPFMAGVLIFRLELHKAITRTIPTIVVTAVLIAMLSVEVRPTWAYQATLSILVYPLIVILGANSQPKVLQGAMIWLGNISYPLYLIHHPLLRIARNVPFVSLLVQEYPKIVITACVLLFCILSTIIFYVYEVRVRALLYRTLIKDKTICIKKSITMVESVE